MKRFGWLAKYCVAGLMIFTAVYVVICTYRLSQDINRPFGGYLTYYNNVTGRNQFVTPVPVWWSGLLPGRLLKTDTFYLIDNQPYSTANEITRFANAFAANRSTVEVIVNRHNEHILVKIPVVLFTWQYFFDLKIPDFLITIGLFLVALIVYRAQPDESLNQLVAVACCMFIPSFTRSSLFFGDGDFSEWAELVMIRYRTFSGPVFFHFVLLFPLTIRGRIHYLLYLWYGLTIFMVFAPLPLIFPTLPPGTINFYGYYFASRSTILGVLCVILYITYVTLATLRYSRLHRRQAGTFLLGVIMASPLFVPVLLNQFLSQPIPIFVQYLDLRYTFLAIPAILAFLILRYRSFQSSSRPLLLVPMLALAGLTTNAVTFAVLRQPAKNGGASVTFLFLFVFLAIFVNSILWSTQSSWQGWFGRLLHRQRRSYEEVRHFGQQVLQQPDLSHLPQAMVQTACQELGLECAAAWLWQSEQNNFRLAAQAGTWSQVLPDALVVAPAQIDNRTAPMRLHAPTALLPSWLHPLQPYQEIVIVTPLKVAERTVGLLALGKRWDETIFDERDLEVIELIGQQAALFLLTAVQVEALRGVPQAIAEAQEKERQRIAQELHDTVQQFLGRLPLFLQASRDMPEEADTILKRCIVDIEDAARTLRHIRSDLEPIALDQGLRQALTYLVDRFRLDHQIETYLDLPNQLDELLAQPTWQHIYRIVGEALTNIAKHAQATEVQISFVPQESGVQFNLADNGIGSTKEQRAEARHQGRRGLQFMGNRLQAIGGSFEVQSQPGQGTQINGLIPYQYTLTLLGIRYRDSNMPLQQDSPQPETPQLHETVWRRWQSRLTTLFLNTKRGRLVMSLCLLSLLIVYLLVISNKTGEQTKIEVVGDVTLEPIKRSKEGWVVIQAEQPVTTTMVVHNFGIESASVGVRLAVRGPNACELGWNDQILDFPLVELDLNSGQTYEYKQQWRFSMVGVYFAEPVKRFQGKWGGLYSSSRQYFVVVENQNDPMPLPNCATPVSTPLTMALPGLTLLNLDWFNLRD